MERKTSECGIENCGGCKNSFEGDTRHRQNPIRKTSLKKVPLNRKVGSTLRGAKRPLTARKSKKVHKVLGVKVWTLKKADSIFSAKIRERDKHCLFPGCGTTLQLTCSHYFGRAKKSTRFDEDNCITLCRTHHYWDKDIGWEFQKQRIGEKTDWNGRYTLYMIDWLGEERWNALLARAEETTSQKKAILAFQEKMAQNNDHTLSTPQQE